MSANTAWYDANADKLIKQYEGISPNQLYNWLEDYLPNSPGLALDIGAGSGRDAAWLASKDFEVFAVEPSTPMRLGATELHSDSNITWIDDYLPKLNVISKMGLTFDLIFVSAVWQHIQSEERYRSFRKIISLLKPGGLLVLTFPLTNSDKRDDVYPVTEKEIRKLSSEHGLIIAHENNSDDLLGRPERKWFHFAVRVPNDGTDALPILRHIILNDEKASTYKLALLRVFCRIANTWPGFVKHQDDDFVSIPLGLVGLTWIKLFIPLLNNYLPQSPQNIGFEHLGFAKTPFKTIARDPNIKLSVGVAFSGTLANIIHQAIRDAILNICNMPARHITYKDGQAIFPVKRINNSLKSNSFILDQQYFESFGSIKIPSLIWQTLQRFNVWVEPVIISEWTSLIQKYAKNRNINLTKSTIANAMVWEEQNRDLGVAHERAKLLLDKNDLRCIWTEKKLNHDDLNIDHCLPWSVWPCGNLWNLMPTHRTVNQHQKRDLLPSEKLLQKSQENIINWWETAYLDVPNSISDQFWIEAHSSLPILDLEQLELTDVFDALCLRQKQLKFDQQVPEWHGPISS